MAKLLIQMPDGEEVTHDLPEDKTTVGRLPENSLPIVDGSISSHHAEIFFQNNTFLVRDLGSTNGTFVNNQKVASSPFPLAHGDELRFGSVPTLFESRNDSGELVTDAQESGSIVSNTSRRPDNFHCSSPVPVKDNDTSPGGMALLIAAAAIGLLAIGGAVYMILQIQPPTF